MSILALVGMAGSGKSVVTMHLQRRGWQRIYFGDFVLREVAARGLHLNPEHERLVREDLRRIHGMAAIAILSLPLIRAAMSVGQVVIDGLYSFAEYKFLRGELGNNLVMLAVTSTRALRYERLAGRAIRPLTLTEAEERDLSEIEHIDKGGPIAIADYTLVNDSTPEVLLAALDALLPKFCNLNL